MNIGNIKVIAVSRKVLAIAAAGFCFFSSAGAAVSNLNLLVEHDISEVGADGVTRSIHFQERVIRRDNVVWIERVIPAAARDALEHAAGGREHKHLDVAGAALWVALEEGKVLNVRLVNAHDKAVINVPAAEYGNIGFDGNWENAWHLLDPRQLKNMKPLTVTAPVGMHWYETSTGNRTVRVLWDDKAAIPRRVMSDDKSGMARKRMTAKDIAAPQGAPWALLGGYQQKEYSDYLD